jgi:peptidyl-Asp metalloendopeptidase
MAVVVIGVMVVALTVAASAHAAAAGARLFYDVPAPPGFGVARAMAPDVVARATRYVQFDLSALGDTHTTLNLFPATFGGTVTAVWDRVEETSPDTWAWIGTVDGVDDSEVTLVVNVAKNIAVGSVVMPRALYRIRYAGQSIHVVEEVDTAAFPEDVVLKAKKPRPGVTDAAQDAATASDTATATSATAADAALTVDLMVLYTPAARLSAGGTTAMNALIDLAVTETNQGYANSGVLHRLRLVHKQELAYTETSGNAFVDALNHVTNNATVATLRNTYGADLVALVIEHTALCGIGWLLNNSPSTGFSVTARNCATGYYSFGHEVGHNLGAEHDWAAPDATNFSATSFNHGYIAPDSAWRTIMSYANGCTAGRPCTRLNRWANPDLTFNGVSTGIQQGQVHAADNRKALNNGAPIVANYKAATSTGCTSTPTITPLSASATASGGAGSITVTALAGCTWSAGSGATWITVTSGAAGSGAGTVNYTVAANAGVARTGTLTVAGRIFTVSQAAAATTTCNTATIPGCPLTSGVAKTGISGAAASAQFYYIDVPAGASQLVVQTSGGTGNVNLYTRWAAIPTTVAYSCRPFLAGNAETCTHNSPAAGRWYIGLSGGVGGYASVTLKATLTTATTCSPTTPPGCALTNGVAKSLLAGALGTNQYYYIDVPAGRPALTVTTSAGTGDVDLYLRFNAVPTATSFTCRPYIDGNAETCSIASPAAGRWYIMLNGYHAYSGVTLKGQY